MFELVDLDTDVRAEMLNELRYDVERGAVYESSRLSASGKAAYVSLLEEAFRDGTPESLATELSRPGVLNKMEPYTRRGVTRTRRVPKNAASTMAEGEFNKYYLRGLCLNVLQIGGTRVLLYRARVSGQPRAESEAKIGQTVDASALLEDLRAHTGADIVDTALGVPPGPNSGLSARHPI